MGGLSYLKRIHGSEKTMQNKYNSTTRYTLRHLTDRNGKERSVVAGDEQYIELECVPGSVRCKGVYVIKKGDVTKICCTFYFHIEAPVRDSNGLVTEPLNHAATCHQGDFLHEGTFTEEVVYMDSDELRPKLKPIRGKKTGNIEGFLMTFPDLPPKFLPKFKKELAKTNRRKKVYSQLRKSRATTESLGKKKRCKVYRKSRAT